MKQYNERPCPVFAGQGFFLDQAMLHIILYQPEIPPNTGNIIRLCANTGARLHLIEPMGFQLDNSRVKRAGLDYHELANTVRYPDWATFRQEKRDMRIWSFSTRGKMNYDRADFLNGDGLLFGPETRGLPQWLIQETGDKQSLRLPMADESRSLNLSNTVAVGLYEAWRQLGFNH
ncbi:MAG: tRNA (cytidine/uridine-2'-O-)-methyltransferase [Lysobacterales bacterium]